MRRHYGPGWTMRVYYDVDAGGGEGVDGDGDTGLSSLCALTCSEPDLDACDASDLPMLGNATFAFPMVWRFFPALDPQVDILLSRDLDSTIGEREAAAVQEFLSSNCSFHAMRDHPGHAAEVLGGMWGAKADRLRPQFVEAFRRLHRSGVLRRVRRRKGTDQEALARFFWPWARGAAMAHDSYFCSADRGRFSSSRWAPFPTRRGAGPGNFVGGVTRNRAELRLDAKWECPLECRPKDHPEWKHC